jgi:hypothetical protein
MSSVKPHEEEALTHVHYNCNWSVAWIAFTHEIPGAHIPTAVAHVFSMNDSTGLYGHAQQGGYVWQTTWMPPV